MDEHTRKAMEGAGAHAMSDGQKRELCMLARQAYDQARRSGAAPDPADDGMCATTAFNVWRRLRQQEACGIGSLKEATNQDYLTIKGFWLRQLGRTPQADKTEARRLGEKVTWAMDRLKRELAAASDVLPGGRQYIEGFLRNKRGVSLEEASVKQIWQAIYTLRRRAGQLRRKQRKRDEEMTGRLL